MNFASLANTAVLGLQWGDEGKGKIVDLLTGHFDVVVRYAGGANAGHTVLIGSERFALHLLPSGILRPGVLNVIAPGVVVDLEILLKEIDALNARGIAVADNLIISDRAHLVMPYHKEQDRLSEAKLSAERRIGTTAKGIGPCYADKMLRASALRVADLCRPAAFRAKLADIVADRSRVFTALYGVHDPLDAKAIADRWLAYFDRIRPLVTDTTYRLHRELSAGRRVLFEGAQGSMLDVNHGTFPFVTSSACTAGGVAAGSGVPPATVKSYVGVVKAYSTRVGGGPFPTELPDATGDLIRERGHEYGTTTGRPRRCGWFDAFAVRYAASLSGVTELAVMHLDTLSAVGPLQVCTGYNVDGRPLEAFPSDAESLAAVAPRYETLHGWDEDVSSARSMDDLPAAARNYLDRLEALVGVPITLVSVGAERSATLHRHMEHGRPRL